MSTKTLDRVENLSSFKPKLKRLNKTALLSYLVKPLKERLSDQETARFSNSGIAISWAQTLNRLGFAVDVIDWNDASPPPKPKYDLVIVHGGKNFEALQKNLKPGYKLIYFSTGTYWKFGNTQEDKRLNDLYKRRGAKLGRDRYINEPEEAVNNAADGIICIGNNYTQNTYSKYPLVIPISNANYPDDHFDKISKDYTEAKNNWLFFAGAGNVHKGLDLVIEAFKELRQNLYIITVAEKKFLDVYKKELALPNIHFIGEVPMRTEKFYEIADMCAFQIFPSCSEGQPGSVVEAMNQGIIPIVSRESGLDADKYGAILEENSVDCIRKTVQKMSALEPKQVEKMARNVRQVALKDHIPQKFQKDLKNAVLAILKHS